MKHKLPSSKHFRIFLSDGLIHCCCKYCESKFEPDTTGDELLAHLRVRHSIFIGTRGKEKPIDAKDKTGKQFPDE